MKKILLCLCILSLFSACKENLLEIPCLSCKDTTPPPPDVKKVVIEEFTGVRCKSCPGGSIALKDLQEIHGENLIVVAIHSGDFSPPLPTSTFDFRTDDGEKIFDFLGAPDGYPSAVINRNKFGGNFLQQGQDAWSGYINQELTETTKVKLDITKSYDPGTRVLSINLGIDVKEDMPGDYKYTLLITESGIVDLQNVDGVMVPDYVHNHVLRDVLTAHNGDLIAENLVAGARIEKTLNFVLPSDWIAENCTIVGHLSETGVGKHILQAEQVGIIN